MPERSERSLRPGPCAKVVAAVFGAIFLVVLLNVPVTTSVSRTRQDQGSNIIVRTSYPRKAAMFLPSYLAMGSEARRARGVKVRATEWAFPLAVVAVLGVFDYLVFCRLLRKPRRDGPEAEAAPGDGFGLG